MKTELPGDSPPNTRNGSLWEQPDAQETLRAIVAGLPGDPVYWSREDLLQEGLLRLWQMEQERPGQTTGWYFQNTKLHLLNLLRAGRSLDSVKHRSARVEIQLQADVEDEVWQHAAVGSARDAMSEICVQDAMDALRHRLSSRDAAILKMLREGRGEREIARLLNISRSAVTECRRTVRGLARELGLGRFGDEG